MRKIYKFKGQRRIFSVRMPNNNKFLIAHKLLYPKSILKLMFTILQFQWNLLERQNALNVATRT